MPWRSASVSLPKATSKPVLQPEQTGHRVRARAVHADLAVVIHGHEREGRVDSRIDHFDLEAVNAIDRLPVVHARAAERVHCELQSRGADRVHVDDVPQVLHVRSREVLLVERRSTLSRSERQTFRRPIVLAQQRIGARLNPARHVGVGRPAVRRVVLEAAILRRVVRRRDDDAVRQPVRAAAVVHENRPRYRRCRRETIARSG